MIRIEPNIQKMSYLLSINKNNDWWAKFLTKNCLSFGPDKILLLVQYS